MLIKSCQRLGGMCLALLLVGCQDFGCQSMEGLVNLPGAPTLDPGVIPTLEPLSKPRLKTISPPGGYTSSPPLRIASGVQFFHFSPHNNDLSRSLRVLHILPSAFKQLDVLFSDTWDRPLSLATVEARPDMMGAMNWSFMGRIPGGDMIGQRCQALGRRCEPGAYTDSESRTGQNTHHRWTLAFNTSHQISLFKGGLADPSTRWYRLAMGGGVLLFDKAQTPQLYKAVGTSGYAALYQSSRYNETRIVQQGHAGDPQRESPRSAMGALADGSFIYVNVGEGRYRFDGGVTPPRLAQLMKSIGCVGALMFDGGGAPVMRLKNRMNQFVVKTQPEQRQVSDYSYNYAFLVLKRQKNGGN